MEGTQIVLTIRDNEVKAQRVLNMGDGESLYYKRYKEDLERNMLKQYH